MSNSKTEPILWMIAAVPCLRSAGMGGALPAAASHTEEASIVPPTSLHFGAAAAAPADTAAVRGGKPLVRTLALVLATALLAGCATETPTPKPSVQEAAVSKPAPAPPAPQPAEKEILPAGAAKPPAPFEGEGWQPMFDSQSLTGWRETQFAGRGEVECRSGVILLNMGDPFTGLNWTNDFPKMDYEVAFDAMRVTGSDFFCGLTVPVGDEFCSLIVGGWGGSVFGISSVDGMDASENETTKFINFEQGRWYRIRLRVTKGRIQGWVDQEKLLDLDTRERKLSVRPGDIELSKPFGLASWQTTAALRELKMRRLTPPDPRNGK